MPGGQSLAFRTQWLKATEAREASRVSFIKCIIEEIEVRYMVMESYQKKGRKGLVFMVLSIDSVSFENGMGSYFGSRESRFSVKCTW